MKRIAFSVAAASLAILGVAPAQSQTIATANTAVNIRSGPGPEHPIIGGIRANRRATIIGCVEGSMWCQVSYRGIQGWAYSQYMTLNPGTTREVVVTERAPLAPAMVPAVTYRAPAYTSAYASTYYAPTYVPPAYAAPTYSAPTYAYTPPPTYAPNVAVTTPGVREFVSPSASGAYAMATDVRGAYAMAPAAVMPPAAVGTYVTSNPLNPVTYGGDVVVGASLPRTVTLQPVPDYRYQYVYVNDQPVLVDPATRRIVYVFR